MSHGSDYLGICFLNCIQSVTFELSQQGLVLEQDLFAAKSCQALFIQR